MSALVCWSHPSNTWCWHNVHFNTLSLLLLSCTNILISLPLLCFQKMGTWLVCAPWHWSHWWGQRIVTSTGCRPLWCPPCKNFYPCSTTQRLTEQETIRLSINERQPHQPHPTVPWPPSSGTPINEFNTEGYISCAFPTLFPTGAADFPAPRPNAVTIGNYFKHLLMYDDGHFARHPRFRYFALNWQLVGFVA